MAAPGGRPVRVLCLHGTASSGAILRKQLSRMQPMLKGEAELVFVDGPLKPASDNPMVAAQEKFWKGMELFDFGRWVKDAEAEIKASEFWEGMLKKYPDPDDQVAYLEKHRDLHWEHSVPRQYEDLEDILEFLQDQLHKHRPIDGVLGFSQGANLCSLLAAQAEAGHGADLSFAVHICPARPGWVQQRPRLFRKPLPMRSLHISGRKDQNPAFACKALYESPTCAMHEDGHRPIPGTTANEANLIARLILDFILNRPLDLPKPKETAREVAPSNQGTEPLPTIARSMARELNVVINIDKDLGIVYEMTVPRGSTVFGLKELIAWQDPTDTLRPEHFTLQRSQASDPLSDTVVLTEDCATLDLRELQAV